MLTFKKEKQVIELVRQHVDATDTCLKKARETFEIYLSGDMQALNVAAGEVNDLESAADELKRQIRDVLYSGAYLPDIRSEIYRLVDYVDSVAGKAEDCANFLLCRSPEIPEEYQAGFIEIFGISVACFNELTRAIKALLKPKGKFEKLQERVNRVGQLETEADELEVAMMKKIFRSSLDQAVKMHLAQFLEMAANIADVTENAAEHLMFTALKSRI